MERPGPTASHSRRIWGFRAVPEMVYPEAAVRRPLRPGSPASLLAGVGATGSDGRAQFREDIASREPLSPGLPHAPAKVNAGSACIWSAQAGES